MTRGQSDQLVDFQHSPSSTTSPSLPESALMVRTRKMFMWCVPSVCAMAMWLTKTGWSYGTLKKKHCCSSVPGGTANSGTTNCQPCSFEIGGGKRVSGVLGGDELQAIRATARTSVRAPATTGW